MRHRLQHRKLNRTSEHRRALRRNLAQSLVEHGQVTTTLAKARDVRPFFERIVALAIKASRRTQERDHVGALRARRAIHRLLGDRALIPAEHREAYNDASDAARSRALRMASGRRHRTGEPRGRLAYTAESVTHRLIEKIAPDYIDRPGGYTRLIRLSKKRVGDAASLAVVQLVGHETAPTSLAKPSKTARQRKADRRYAAAISASKSWSRSGKSGQEVSDHVSSSEPDSQGPAGSGNDGDSAETT